jgi:hypothetical protein
MVSKVAPMADKFTTLPCQFCGRPTPVKLDTRHKLPIPTITNPFCKNPGIDFKLILESMSDLVTFHSNSKKDSKALLESLRESELKSALENKDFAEKFERFKCYAARKEQQSTVRSTFVPSYL